MISHVERPEIDTWAHHESFPSLKDGDGEKPNFCTNKGDCTAPSFDDEKLCRHYKPSIFYFQSGGCIMRAWFAGCMSPEATKEAKQQGLMTNRNNGEMTWQPTAT